MWNSSSAAEFRSNNFGLLRLGLSSLVVFAHSFVAANGSNRGEPLYELTAGGLDLGALAVNGFFIASGFMVSESLAQGRGTADFLHKRIRRLYPAFVLLWLIQTFLIAPVVTPERFSGYSVKQWGTVLFNLASLSSYGYPYGGLLKVFPDNPVPGEMNVSLWTLRYEFGCYLALGFLGFLGLFRRRWLVSALLVAFWSLYVSGVTLPWHRILTALLADGAYWPRFATFFLAGVTFWHWRHAIPRNTSLALAAAGLLLGSLFRPEFIPLVLPAAWTYLLLWLAYAKIQRLAGFGNRVDVSYGTYLYAFPIQQLIMVALPKANPWLVFALSLPASLLAGLASWHLVEKRFLRQASKSPTLTPNPPGNR